MIDENSTRENKDYENLIYTKKQMFSSVVISCVLTSLITYSVTQAINKENIKLASTAVVIKNEPNKNEQKNNNYPELESYKFSPNIASIEINPKDQLNSSVGFLINSVALITYRSSMPDLSFFESKGCSLIPYGKNKILIVKFGNEETGTFIKNLVKLVQSRGLSDFKILKADINYAKFETNDNDLAEFLRKNGYVVYKDANEKTVTVSKSTK